MNIKRLLFNPGDFLAQRLDQNYAKFAKRIEEKIKRRDRRIVFCTHLARVERGIAFLVGVLTHYFGHVLAILLCIYPLAVIIDPHMWRIIYRQSAQIGYKTSLLLNLDALYWCAVGLVVGFILKQI